LTASSGPLQVFVLNLSPEKFDAISAFDLERQPARSQLAFACAALWEAGLRLAQIAEVLGLGVGVSVVQRYAAAAGFDDYCLRMLDRGQLDFGHLRLLSSKTEQERHAWAEKIVAQGLSVRALAKRLASTTESVSLDHQRYERLIAEGLQSDGLRLTRRGSGYALEVDWSWLPALQGVFKRLGQAPMSETSDRLPRLPRTLVLEVASDDELDALVGHLLPEL